MKIHLWLEPSTKNFLVMYVVFAVWIFKGQVHDNKYRPTSTGHKEGAVYYQRQQCIISSRFMHQFTISISPQNCVICRHPELYIIGNYEKSLTISRSQRTFLWCSLCSLNFQRPGRICSLDWAYRSRYWIVPWGIVLYHKPHKCQLQCISTILWRNLGGHFGPHNCWQTRRRPLFYWPLCLEAVRCF